MICQQNANASFSIHQKKKSINQPRILQGRAPSGDLSHRTTGGGVRAAEALVLGSIT